MTQSALHLNVNFWAIKSRFAFCFIIICSRRLDDLTKSIFALFPKLVVAKIFFSIVFVAKRKSQSVIFKPKIFVNFQNERDNTIHFIGNLFWRAENVAVVLRERSGSFKTTQVSAVFKTEVVCNLSNSYRQITIRVHIMLKHNHVVWAVHRSKHISLVVELHGWKHIVFIVVPVTRSFV